MEEAEVTQQEEVEIDASGDAQASKKASRGAGSARQRADDANELPIE